MKFRATYYCFVPTRISNIIWIILFSLSIVNPVSAQNQIPEEIIVQDWERSYYGKLEGQETLLYTRSFDRSQITFGDIDGDGLDDMFIGKADGRVGYFKNKGALGSPKFDLISEDFEADFLETGANQETYKTHKIIDVGDNAAPFLVDIDDDSDLDLFIGSKDGTIWFFENLGNPLLPIFQLQTPNYMNIRPGSNSIPRFADFNSDRANDLIVGTHIGKVFLYRNQGVPSRADFCGEGLHPKGNVNRLCKYPREMITDILPEIDASPAIIDWNQDKKWDLVVGKGNGMMSFYLNRGDIFNHKWELITNRFLFIDGGGFASPTFYDINADGFPELLIGTGTSNIVYYYNREVLLGGLKKIKKLNLATFDQNDGPLKNLEKACADLGGPALCLPILFEAFNVPAQVTKDLKSLLQFIVNPKAASVANDKKNTTPGTPAGGAAGADGANPAQPTTPAAGTGATPAAGAAAGGAPGARAQQLIRRPSAAANEMNLRELKIPAQANAPAPGAQAPDAPAAAGAVAPGATPPAAPAIEKVNLGEGTRNNYWLANRNFLNFGHFVVADRRTIVTSGDIDGDGDTDLMLGSASGRIYYYENGGTNKEANWKRVQDPAFEPNGRSFSAPTLVDIDSDGDFDLISGSQTGRLELIRNQGAKNRPLWKIENLNYSDVDVGNFSIPVFFDFDGDGDLDMFAGNGKGKVIFYENLGTTKDPKFELKSTKFGGLSVAQNAAPAFFPWKGDELQDLILGTMEGQLRISFNRHIQGTPFTRGWEPSENPIVGIDSFGYSAPHFADLNNDQRKDLFLGDKEGHVSLWFSKGTRKIIKETPLIADKNNTLESGSEGESTDNAKVIEEELAKEEEPKDLPFDPKWELVTKDLLGTYIGHRTAPAFFDLDHDGKLDMLVGTKEGMLQQFINDGIPEAPQWRLVNKNYLDYSGGKNATPLFADVENDGDIDLLIGSERGGITFYENRGNAEFSDFVLNNTPFTGVTGGLNSRVAVVDVSGDGLPDLLLGNFSGQLVEYIQVPTANGYIFQLVHRKYLDLDVGIGATPFVADLNNDKINDLIVGSDHGPIAAFSPVVIDEKNKWGWLRDDKFFQKVETPVGSFPMLVDLNNDSKMDLVIGSEQGNIYFYRNIGEPGLQEAKK